MGEIIKYGRNFRVCTYLLTYLSPVVTALLFSFSNRKQYLVIPAACLVVIAGWGYNIGVDYFAYIDMQETAPAFGSDLFLQKFSAYYQRHGVEIIYAIFNVMLVSLGLGPQSIFVLMAALSSYFIYKISSRFSPPSASLIFVACYVLAFSGIWNQIRYGLSILMAVYACIVFCEGRKGTAFTMLLLAAGIHSIAIAMFFALIFYRMFSKTRLSLALLAFLLITFSVVLSCIDVQAVLRSILILVNDRYSAYTSSDGSQLNFLVRLGFFLFVFFLLSKSAIRNDSFMSVLFILMLFSLVVWSIAWRIDVLYRVGVMFEFGYLLLFMRRAYVKPEYYYLGVTSLLTLLGWRLIKGMGVLNDYSFVLF